MIVSAVPVIPMLPITFSKARATSVDFLQWCTTMIAISAGATCVGRHTLRPLDRIFGRSTGIKDALHSIDNDAL